MPSLNKSVSSLCAKSAFLVQIMFGYANGFCNACFFFVVVVVIVFFDLPSARGLSLINDTPVIP